MFTFYTLPDTRVLNSFEELCIMRAEAENSFARVLNPHGGAYILSSTDRLFRCDTDFFDIVTGVLQVDIFVQNLFVICLDYILWTSIDIIKENSFTVKVARSRWYPVEIIADPEYTYYQVRHINSPAQAKSLLHNLEQAAGIICLHVNTKEPWVHVFKWEGVISSLSGRPLEFVGKFTDLSSNISSTESYVSIYLSTGYQSYGNLITPIK